MEKLSSNIIKSIFKTFGTTINYVGFLFNLHKNITLFYFLLFSNYSFQKYLEHKYLFFINEIVFLEFTSIITIYLEKIVVIVFVLMILYKLQTFFNLNYDSSFQKIFLVKFQLLIIVINLLIHTFVIFYSNSNHALLDLINYQYILVSKITYLFSYLGITKSIAEKLIIIWLISDTTTNMFTNKCNK